MILFYFIVFLLALAFGSFFNVCIWRIPRKESIILPASHCPQCGNKLKSWQNIPIVSWFILKGKCHFCGKKVSIQYLIIEIVTPIVWLLLLQRFAPHSVWVWVKYLLLYSMGIIIFFIDLNHRIIPDIISLPLIALGFIASLIPPMDMDIWQALGGAAGGFAFLFLLALAVSHSLGKESLGGGDIKLVTALGMFMGFKGVLFTMFFAATIALITIFILRKNRSAAIPFGPFLVTGAFIYTLLGNWIISFYLQLFIRY